MAQTNFTPIQLYYSTTGAAAPTAGNLANGELAINITDGKLFYKDNLGAVQVLATKAGASGDVVGPASSTDNALVRFDTTTGKLVQNSVGILSDAGALSGLTSVTLSANLNFTGTGNRITGDFSSTPTSRVAFQTSTTNGNTNLEVIPNGTSTTVAINLESDPALTNGTFLQLGLNGGTDARFTSAIRGTGTYLPMTFYTGNSERLRIDTSGNVGIGTSSPTGKLDLFTSATAGPISSLTFSANNIATTKTDYVQLSPTIELNSAGGEAGGYTLKVKQQGAYKDSIVAGGITNNASNYLAFSTTSEAVRITSAGNVGIGTLSPGVRLDVAAALGAVNVTSSTGTNYVKVQVNNTGGSFQFGIDNSTGSNFGLGAYSRVLWNDGAYSTVFTTNATERMRIDSSGNLLVGQTSTTASLGKSVQITNGSSLGQYAAGPGSSAQTYTFGRDNVSTGNFVFAYNGAVISSISPSTGIYTPLSDIRVKKNVMPLQYGLNEILQLSPVIYNMASEKDSDKKHIGLIAQQVKSVLDEAVDDLIDPEKQMYGLDKSVLVPVLVKAMQEQQALIQTLTARVAALESN